MKRYLYLILFLLQPMAKAEEKKAPQHTPTQQPVAQTNQNAAPRDYGPEILSTFFYSMIPSFLKVALGAETDNPELVYQGFAGLSQGVGTVINLAARTPNNTECLKASKAFLVYLKKNKSKVRKLSHLKKQK